VFIGARAIILKGVTIGKNSIIGAGAIVSSNVPPNVIITNKNSVMKNLKESV
jgi:acetyltransferase-like isoleucine patch superfamily enzyme